MKLEDVVELALWADNFADFQNRLYDYKRTKEIEAEDEERTNTDAS